MRIRADSNGWAMSAPGSARGDGFVDAVLELVAGIPAGRVMGYGDVAAELGSRASRQVGKIMAHHGGTVPWWRVIRSDGRPPAGHEADALRHYREERTPLRETADGYRVSMRLARWRPWAEGGNGSAE